MRKSAYEVGDNLRVAFCHLRRSSRYRSGAIALLLSVILGITCTFPQADRQVQAVAPPPRAEIFPALRCIRTIKAHIKRGRGLAFSPDGSMVATTGDEKVVLWDVATGAKIGERHRKDALYLDVAFLGTGGELACITRGDLRVMETPSLRDKRTICMFDGTIASVCCSRDGKSLFTTNGITAGGWDARSSKNIWSHKFTDSSSRPAIVAASVSGNRVAVACDHLEYCVSVRDGASGKELYRIPNPESRVPETINKLTFTPDGRFIMASFHMHSSVRIWDSTNGKLARNVVLKLNTVSELGESADPSNLPYVTSYAMAVSPDGKSFAVVCSDNLLRVYEMVTGGLRGQQEGRAITIAFSPGGRSLATLGGSDGLLRFWDLRDTGKGAMRKIEPQERQRLWDDLGSEDARIGFSSILRLGNDPLPALDILRRLKRVPPVPPGRVVRLVERLDDDDFASRETATRELEGLGIVAEAALRQEAARPRSQESGVRAAKLLDALAIYRKERILHARAVEVLEAIGNADAERILTQLAGGHAGIVETEDARAALVRLNARSK